MKIEKFIQQYTIQDIKKIEHSDPQFLALKSARNKISDQSQANQNLFIFLTLQCALISYQISGGGELWREEFGQKITQDRHILNTLWQNKRSNTDRRYNFLITSKYNKRIYNTKTSRLKKFDNILGQTTNFKLYQNNMTKLQELIAQTMDTNKQSKTIVFAIKMFGYAYQITSPNNINYPIYPMSISIPIDSRIKKIYTTQRPKNHTNNTHIQNYFNNLSKKYNIPSLHLDSILWLKYWKTLTKQSGGHS